VSKQDLALLPSILASARDVLKKSIYKRVVSPSSPASSPRLRSAVLQTCTTVVTDDDTARLAVKWVLTRLDSPSRIQTTVSLAPLLLALIANAVYITISAQRSKTNHDSAGESLSCMEVVLTYRCMRASSHRDDDEAMPLLSSYFWNGKPVQRKKTPPIGAQRVFLSIPPAASHVSPI
jgi:hypothetical protein